MRFVSTRGGDTATFSEAFIKGLASDGGLFVPETLPDISGRIEAWRSASYSQIAAEFLSLFADDIPAAELRECVEQAYATFAQTDATSTGGKGAPPLVKVSSRWTKVTVMELFHGPTLAFKDYALQLLGQLYGRHIRATGRPVNILGATSGDTGSAAIHAMLGQKAAHSFILYPDKRIAELQERQIACTGSPNVHPIAIQGTFDNAQAIVKKIFGDAAFTAAHSLTAINSINIARILAQCVYYIYAATRHPVRPLEFFVPTGNFGNVLAGWLLTKMGLHDLRFCLATNGNNVMSEFFHYGRYCPGKVEPSLAPSMDIQQASNFERWLWYYFKGNAALVREALDDLSCRGAFTLKILPHKIGTATLRGSASDNRNIGTNLASVLEEYAYVCDPHTSCAFSALRSGVFSDTPDDSRVVVATAHPAKFPETVEKFARTVSADAVLPTTHPTLEALKTRPIVREVLPANVDAVKDAIQRALA